MGCDHPPARVPRVETRTDCVQVTWPDGHAGRFPHFWLRENCPCPQCTHPEAWERIVDFMTIPLNVRPDAVEADAVGLRLTWPSGDVPCDGTRYSWDWLDSHRLERDARLARKRRIRGWTGSTISKDSLAVPYDAVMVGDDDLERLLAHVDSAGLGFVVGVPTDRLVVTEIAERIAFVEESHFGRHFDVVSKVDPENLAYTPNALQPHNDLPSRQHLPGVQLLHCRRNDVAGGDNVFVDGIAVACRLREQNPAAFDLLSRRPVMFRSVAADWEIANRATIIAVDEDGDVVGTRVHPALLGPVDIEPDEQPAFYSAHRELLSIALEAEMQFSFRFEEGDCVIFDNARILHARTAFDATTGYRHLQGCYVGRDDLKSRLQLLRRRGTEYRIR
ncbi:MAG: TauD/TfdA family dioxygenase [Gammaproteobacteria bacterium]|nr:TauD/TfdA family dioxygenase [Gammaproteobacteria bacterium]